MVMLLLLLLLAITGRGSCARFGALLSHRCHQHAHNTLFKHEATDRTSRCIKKEWDGGLFTCMSASAAPRLSTLMVMLLLLLLASQGAAAAPGLVCCTT
jgi:hypothetical protein